MVCFTEETSFSEVLHRLPHIGMSSIDAVADLSIGGWDTRFLIELVDGFEDVLFQIGAASHCHR